MTSGEEVKFERKTSCPAGERRAECRVQADRRPARTDERFTMTNNEDRNADSL
jgi:hypothetical protein